MKTTFKLSLIAALLVAAGVAYSQSPMKGQCDPMMGMGMGMGMQGPGMRHGHMDTARMQAKMDQHHAALKAQLKITAAQEAAWTQFTDTAKPGAAMMAQQPDPADMAKLTTPERMDKMKALRAQHMADMSTAMDKHFEATKALYTVLTPEQQKVFDTHAMQGPGRSGKRGPGNGPMQPMAPKS